MEIRTFKVPNIGCDACVSKIKQEIGQLNGVAHVEGDKDTQLVKVEWQAPATWQLIVSHLVEIDYTPVEA